MTPRRRNPVTDVTPTDRRAAPTLFMSAQRAMVGDAAAQASQGDKR